MFPQTSSVFQHQSIHHFEDPEDVGNKALYLLIASRVDEYFQRLIKHVDGYGNKALTLLFKQCAHIEASDKHHFHHLFTSLRIRDNEIATNFFRRFTFAKMEAEAAHNVYTDSEAVDFALSGLTSTKIPRYDTALQLFSMTKDNGEAITLEQLQQKFFTIDEKSARDITSFCLVSGSLGSIFSATFQFRSRRGERIRQRRTIYYERQTIQWESSWSRWWTQFSTSKYSFQRHHYHLS
jgi:hypothetical protein